MVWFYLAYILFMVGGALGVVERGSELSLWFIALAWVLNLSLLGLVLLKSPRLKGPRLSVLGITAHGLAMLAIPLLLYFRAKADMPTFMFMLAGTVFLWSISMIAVKRGSSQTMEA